MGSFLALDPEVDRASENWISLKLALGKVQV